MSALKERLIYFAKISSIAIFSFIKIHLLSATSTVIVTIIGFILLSKNIDAGHSGHVSAIPFLVMMFTARPVGSVLIMLVLFASPFVFFALGNKYIIGKISNRLIEDKSEKYIFPLLDKVLSKIKNNQPELIQQGADYSKLQLKLMQETKNQTDNKWLKRVISFGLKKIQLNDVDFQQENASFTDIIKTKTIQALENISAPSKKNIWIVVGLQWLFLLLVWVLPY